MHRHLLGLLRTKADRLASDYGVLLRVVWAADSSAIRLHPAGFEPETLANFKKRGGRLADFDQGQCVTTHMTSCSESEFDSLADVDLLFESTPVDLESGGFGLRIARASLARATHVVLANKGPLVVDFRGIAAEARKFGRRVAFSATVCGGLPIVNIGQRDFPLANITAIRGIFNSTTNFMLGEMHRGREYSAALEQAQRRGIAETDPRHDVEGWDSAAKLVILANAVLRTAAGLDDVSIQGITTLAADGAGGADEHRIVKLIAEATQQQNGYRLSVAPVAVDEDSFLGSCEGWEMGLEVDTDIYGRQFFKIWEREPVPTAAALLRDAIDILVGINTEASPNDNET